MKKTLVAYFSASGVTKKVALKWPMRSVRILSRSSPP